MADANGGGLRPVPASGVGDALGEVLYTRSVALRGRLSETKWADFLGELTAALGMNPVYKPAIWKYPVKGLGGTGTTIVQPITESFLALDIWPDHGGAYLMVCSCKNFSPASVERVCLEFGLVSGDILYGALRINGL